MGSRWHTSWSGHAIKIEVCQSKRGRFLKGGLVYLFFFFLILTPHINSLQCRLCTLFCIHKRRRKKKKRHSLCSWDVCNLTQQFHFPILYASLLTAFTSSSFSLNWGSRGKTRHRDNGILCCGLWLHFPSKAPIFHIVNNNVLCKKNS